jgi:MFS family permease
MSSGSNKQSTFAALRNPVFRRLWLASLISGTCVAAHDTAAVWVMNTLSSSALSLSMMSTVASLPLFLFTLPAGVLADMVNRRKLLRYVNLWLTFAAGLPAVLGSLRLLSPNFLLFCVFMIGLGFAFNAPAWSAFVSDVVAVEELPSAAALGGLQLNVSGIIGPALGGVLLYLLGANWVFAANAICFVGIIFSLLPWKRVKAETQLPLEDFFESLSTAILYVRRAPAIRVVLARNVLFAFFISVIPALIPVVGLKELHLQPCSLGLLFTSMGAGSVFSAVFVLPRLREKLSSNASTILANLLEAVVYLLMAFVRQPLIFMIVAALAGLGWTVAASELWLAGQRAIPGWGRGRMNAIVIMVSQGGIALGGMTWGLASQVAGVNTTLIVAAVAFTVSLFLAIPLSINFPASSDSQPVSSRSKPRGQTFIYDIVAQKERISQRCQPSHKSNG